MREESILIEEFMDEIRERAERDFKGHLHKSFVAWFIEAEYGNCDWKFTDGPGDNGIDALVWRPNEIPAVVIVQSKFTENVGRSLLSKTAYREFEAVIDAFRADRDAFSAWLTKSSLGLGTQYRKAKDRLDDECQSWLQKKKAFQLITTHNGRPSEESASVPSNGYVYAESILDLYRRHRRDQTPRARDIVLSADRLIPYRDGQRKENSYLFSTKVSDFRAYLKSNDVARLVARNIRYELPGRVGRNIRATYEKFPHDFWYLHNGLTIVCDQLEYRKRKATLIHPSVINGAQTLYAISHCQPGRNSAEVCVRAIVRGARSNAPVEDDEWLQRIIKGVNTQNRVRTFDLRSNEPEQIALQKKFREVRVFYERKRGEWRSDRLDPRFKAFSRVSLPGLGKILTAANRKDGTGPLLVKRGLDELFEDRNYEALFPSKSAVNYRFPKIYFAWRLYDLLYSFGYMNSKQQRLQRHAFWHSYWLVHHLSGANGGLLEGLSSEQIKRAFDHCHDDFWVRAKAKKAMKSATKAAWKVWRFARRKNPESLSSVNFFKTREASRLLLQKGAPICRGELKLFFKELSGIARA
jgi:AIPR protein